MSLSNNSNKKVLEDVSNFLEDIVKPSRKKPRLLTVDSYLDRLWTFTSSNYFAKPVGVSPIVCAAHGWYCISTDIVECSSCHAKVAILFDRNFTPTQQEKMTIYYHEKIARKGHESELCIFYDRNKNNEDVTIPFHLASAWDSDLIQLLSDSPNPLKILKEDHIPYLLKNVKTTTPRYPILPRLPTSINDDLDMVRTVLKDMGDLSNPKASRLALFGWTKGICRLCLAKLPSNKNSNGSELLLSCHKYYCPYRCGISYLIDCEGTTTIKTTEPCWKIICQQVLSSTINNNMEEKEDTSLVSAQNSLKKIRSLLNELDK